MGVPFNSYDDFRFLSGHFSGYGGCALVQLETKPLETQRGAYDQAPRKFDFDKDGVGRDM